VYARIEPFGPHAEELRLGILGQIMVALGGDGKKKFTPYDFTLSQVDTVPRNSPEAVAAQIKEVFGGMIGPKENAT